MTASLVRALPDPPCAGPACPRATALVASRGFVVFVRVAPRHRLHWFPEQEVARAAAASPARALPPLARHDLPLRRASPLEPCQLMSRPNRAPWTRRRVQRI